MGQTSAGALLPGQTLGSSPSEEERTKDHHCQCTAAPAPHGQVQPGDTGATRHHPALEELGCAPRRQTEKHPDMRIWQKRSMQRHE